MIFSSQPFQLIDTRITDSQDNFEGKRLGRGPSQIWRHGACGESSGVSVHLLLLPEGRSQEDEKGECQRGLQEPGAGDSWWSGSSGGGWRRVGVNIAALAGQGGVGLVGAAELTVVVHPAIFVGGAGELLDQVEVLLVTAVFSVTAGLVAT